MVPETNEDLVELRWWWNAQGFVGRVAGLVQGGNKLFGAGFTHNLPDHVGAYHVTDTQPIGDFKGNGAGSHSGSSSYQDNEGVLTPAELLPVHVLGGYFLIIIP